MAAHGHTRYWDAEGPGETRPGAAVSVGRARSVGPHLDDHAHLGDGLPVLREALHMASAYYPETLRRVWFYKPTFIFRAILAMMKVWVAKETAAKFVVVPLGQEKAHFLGPGLDACDPSHVPRELGGSGPTLGGDRFLARAMERYDAV